MAELYTNSTNEFLKTVLTSVDFNGLEFNSQFKQKIYSIEKPKRNLSVKSVIPKNIQLKKVSSFNEVYDQSEKYTEGTFTLKSLEKIFKMRALIEDMDNLCHATLGEKYAYKLHGAALIPINCIYFTDSKNDSGKAITTKYLIEYNITKIHTSPANKVYKRQLFSHNQLQNTCQNFYYRSVLNLTQNTLSSFIYDSFSNKIYVTNLHMNKCKADKQKRTNRLPNMFAAYLGKIFRMESRQEVDFFTRTMPFK